MMNCCCNTQDDKKIQYLDIEGLKYFVSILDRVITARDRDVLKTAKRYTDESIAELRNYTIEQIAALREEVKHYIDDTAYLKAEDIFLEGDILMIRKPDGTYIEIDLSGLGSKVELTFAEIEDIDAMFEDDRPIITAPLSME